MPASYKIPQNVDLEDKIFGPLTLRQFLMVLAAGLITFVSFSAFWDLSPPVFYITTILTWVTALAFTFVRPYDQSFSKFFFSLLWFTLKPQRRVWKRLPSLAAITLEDKQEQPVAVDTGLSEGQVHSRLQRLSHIVDTRGWSNVDTGSSDVAGRINSGEAKPKLNIDMATSEQPVDILQREDEATGSDRATSELDRMLKEGVTKPNVKRSAANHPQRTT